MTDQELKDIVAAVVAELEKSGVDFDYKAEQAKDDDLVFVIRGTAPNYQGVTVTWKGLLDIITAQATQAKNDAETAKNTANTILEQVQSKGTEITNFVATSKAELETQKNESVNAVKSVYQTDLNELKGDLSTLDISKDYKEFLNGYLNWEGAFIEANGWKSTDFIPVVGGEKINVNIFASGINDNWYNLYGYNKHKTFVKGLIKQSTATEISETVTLPYNIAYVRYMVNANDLANHPNFSLSYNSVTSILAKNKTDIEAIKTTIEPIDGIYKKNDTTGTKVHGYVDATTGVIGSSESWYRTDFINVKNKLVYFTGTVLNFVGVAGYDENKKYVCAIVANENKTYSDARLTIPSSVKYIIASSLYEPLKVETISIPNTDDIEIELNSLIKSNYATVALFENIAVIGDSYSCGAVYGDNVGTQGEHHGMSWGKIMARRNGISSTLYAQGGITTKGWLVGMDDGYHYAILPKLLADEPKNLYLIMLGINDTRDGSISDCNEDWTLNNDTWYGNYGKVIGNIKAHAPNAKIICIKPPFGGKSAYAFEAIGEVADFYGVPCISSYDDDYFSSSFYENNLVTSHPIGITYSGMALAFERLIAKCMVENSVYFKDYNGNN